MGPVHPISRRHGGMVYELRRQSARVQIGRGMRIDTTDAVLRVLSERSELLVLATRPSLVANNKAAPVTHDWLLITWVGSWISTVSKSTATATVTRPRPRKLPKTPRPPWQPPSWPSTAAAISAVLVRSAPCPRCALTAACSTHPVMMREASLLYVTSELPSAYRAARANGGLTRCARFFSHRFRMFPLVDPVSVGVLISALLAAALARACPPARLTASTRLRLGPKTFLAKCVAALGTGGDVSVMPPAKDEEEWRKHLLPGCAAVTRCCCCNSWSPSATRPSTRSSPRPPTRTASWASPPRRSFLTRPCS